MTIAATDEWIITVLAAALITLATAQLLSADEVIVSAPTAAEFSYRLVDSANYLAETVFDFLMELSCVRVILYYLWVVKYLLNLFHLTIVIDPMDCTDDYCSSFSLNNHHYLLGYFSTIILAKSSYVYANNHFHNHHCHDNKLP